MDVTDIQINTYMTLNDMPFITNTVVITWGIALLLFALSILTTRRMKAVPGTLQLFMELIIEGIHWLVDKTMGSDKRNFAPYMLALSLYMLIANLTGLVVVRQPTADLNTTFALAAITFVMVHFNGFRMKKLRYIKGFFEPLPFMFPLNIISEIALPISLSFRLFGNMLGSLIIMFMLYHFAPPLAPIIGHAYFDVFAGVIQTFIFVMLTMTFVSLAME